MDIDSSITDQQRVEFMEFLHDLLHERRVETYVDIHHELMDYLKHNPPHDYRPEIVDAAINPAVSAIAGVFPAQKPDNERFPSSIRDLYL